MKILEGKPFPLGLSFEEGVANFALFSHHAEQAFLGLFPPGREGGAPEREIPLWRTGDFWHAAVVGLSEKWSYAFRCFGRSGDGLFFEKNAWLFDPYAKIPKVPWKWGEKEHERGHTLCRLPPPFDWQGVKPPRIPLSDLVLYEMHVRGFTRHSSSGCHYPGTFLGVIEKIPYLNQLGVNAVELMPIFDFDETHCKFFHPKSKAPLPNYWGYSPIHFFAPMRRFAFSSEPDAPINEFKEMVRELHRHGIEVILDVVYNHTGEDASVPPHHLRGIDNAVYYMVDARGKPRDFTGCGNTLNANHPIVQKWILDSLRYWVGEMGVDGFRFDLASTLTRGTHGEVLHNPPLLKAIASDPLLSKVKLIAEAWDASGLYQVGSFPQWGPWSEWNGRYRDTIRRFIKGNRNSSSLFASSLCGSEPIYGYSRSPLSSINFITAHDGSSLCDLVSYQKKHNEENGENNRDGGSLDDNWNCGVEGATSDPSIIKLRERQMRNFLLALFLSRGIPMLLMGDEYGHTRRGNNNPYVQDNEINWFLWDEWEKRSALFFFTSALIAFRKKHPSLHRGQFFTPEEIDWHGTTPHSPHWHASHPFIALTIKEKPSLYAAFNATHQTALITLPSEASWKEVVRTDRGWEDHFLDTPKAGPLLSSHIELPPYSALLAIHK